MGLWKTMPGYPTKEDVVYEIASYLLKDGRSNGEFSLQTFNSIYGSKWEETSHGSLIKEMMETGEITETKKSTASKRWFKINKTQE